MEALSARGAAASGSVKPPGPRRGRQLALAALAVGLGAGCSGLTVCNSHSAEFHAHGTCGPDAVVSVGFDDCGNAFTGYGSESAGLPQLAGTVNAAEVVFADGGPAPLPDGGQVVDGGVVVPSVRVCSLDGNPDAGWAVRCQIYPGCAPDAGCDSIAECDDTLSP